MRLLHKKMKKKKIINRKKRRQNYVLKKLNTMRPVRAFYRNAGYKKIKLIQNAFLQFEGIQKSVYQIV